MKSPNGAEQHTKDTYGLCWNFANSVLGDCADMGFSRKSFRPAYSKLDSLCSIFPKVPVMALTATATTAKKDKIQKSLDLNDPETIEVNPDRPNIFFSTQLRPSKKEMRNCILDEYVEELKVKRNNMPLTIFYGNLETCAESFMYFSYQMGDMQYDPPNADKIAKNRLFTQFHAQYPKAQRERIVEELTAGNSKHRILFVTVAFGIGIDCSTIRRVVHLGVPHTMEEYFQEAGRSGRDGQPAEAILYYNSYDISKGKNGLQNSMIEYAKSTNQCKRKLILAYFGYGVPEQTKKDHTCCDYHRQICSCSECTQHVLEVSDVEMANLTVDDNRVEMPAYITKKQKEMLREKLITYRQSLGESRSCVGSISFYTGFSLELIDIVVQNCEKLLSAEDVFNYCPAFSKENADVIVKIVNGVLHCQ